MTIFIILWFQMTISSKLSTSNFLRQFRSDENSGELGKLSSVQFMEVWEHYDKDGDLILDIIIIIRTISTKNYVKNVSYTEGTSF